jgi:hypothetical protein
VSPDTIMTAVTLASSRVFVGVSHAAPARRRTAALPPLASTGPRCAGTSSSTRTVFRESCRARLPLRRRLPLLRTTYIVITVLPSHPLPSLTCFVSCRAKGERSARGPQPALRQSLSLVTLSPRRTLLCGPVRASGGEEHKPGQLW